MFCGVIEGFYGRPWSWGDRRTMLDFLACNHFSHYCYAPKADGWLRNNWQLPWPADMFAHLQALSDHAAERGLTFGIGISPLSLLQNEAGELTLLEKKLQQIALLKPGFIAVLFDDIRGDKPQLAEKQSRILHFVRSQLPDTHLLMCPTYYSHDPVLTELFGAMPQDYWQILGQSLPDTVEILWTGDKVISSEYPAQSLQDIAASLQRKPVIWDNSCVNDGRKSSPFLPVRAMFNLKAIEPFVNGVLVNPMNQPHLARLVLKTLTLSGNAEQRLSQALSQEVPELKTAIENCLPLMRDKGLEKLDSRERKSIEANFAHSNAAVAREIRAWLAGDYRFDPDCLT